MKIYRNQLPIRILGTMTGVGFLFIGAYALFGGEGLDNYTQDRAYGFALATIIAGAWAISISWLDSDLSGVWCRSPKRWRKKLPGS